MNVADAMTPRSEVITAELPGTREDVLVQFQERSFSSVPVLNKSSGKEEYRGIISRKDLIKRPEEDQLALLMRETPTIESGATIKELVALILQEGHRRIPVVDERLEGIITVTDVVKAIADGDVETEATVGEVATQNINTTYAKTPLTVAEQEIYFANEPYSVVLNDEAEMTGILTEVDIIEVARVVEGETETGDSIAGQDDEWMWEGIKAVGNRYLPTRNVEIPVGPVEDFMTHDVVTVSDRRTVSEAARLFISNDIEQIPVVSGDELTAIVRDIDLLEAV
jgi:CBS domain-containing protein